MHYEYQCPKCLVFTDVYKPVAEIDNEELCPGCSTEKMQRMISAVQINTSNCQYDAHFNPAFGKVVSSKNQVRDEIRKQKYEHGRDIVEVGNDSLKSIKKQRKEYSIDS